MVTLQKSGKRKNHSNRMKITLKKSENHSKASENHSKREWKSLQKSEFHFFGEARWATALLFRAVPLWQSGFYAFHSFEE